MHQQCHLVSQFRTEESGLYLCTSICVLASSRTEFAQNNCLQLKCPYVLTLYRGRCVCSEPHLSQGSFNHRAHGQNTYQKCFCRATYEGSACPPLLTAGGKWRVHSAHRTGQVSYWGWCRRRSVPCRSRWWTPQQPRSKISAPVAFCFEDLRQNWCQLRNFKKCFNFII